MDNKQINASTSVPQKPTIDRKISWHGGPSKKQDFSLPPSIIYYIAKNPSTPTAYLKLIKSCKYFFEKLPIIVARNISWKIPTLCNYDERECAENEHVCCVEVDLAKISSQIWLTDELCASAPNVFSLLSSKLYRSDVYYISLYDQQIFYDDFKFAASFAEEILLYNVKMLYGDGSTVMLDGILGALPMVEKIEYFHQSDSPTIGSSTLKNISQLQNLSNLQALDLIDIPEIEEVEDFLTIIKELKDAKIRLKFDKNISEQFKNRLDFIVDIVIKDGASNCEIEYDGQDAGKLAIMSTRFD